MARGVGYLYDQRPGKESGIRIQELASGSGLFCFSNIFIAYLIHKGAW